MPLSLFGRSRGEDGKTKAADRAHSQSSGVAKDGAAQGDAVAKGDGKVSKKKAKQIKRELQKANRFFTYAEEQSDRHQYDFAIDCYLDGLNHNPDNVAKHDDLRKVALRRRVNEGRPATFAEKLRRPARDRIQKMLKAEFVWAKDPLNLAALIATMARAVEADEFEKDYRLGEVAYWIGSLLLKRDQTDKAPRSNDFIEVRDLFERIEAWDKAAQACRMALALDPDNSKLKEEYRDFLTEEAMQKGGYAENYRQSLRNEELQLDLQAEDAGAARTQDQAERLLNRRREEFREKPDDMDARLKLVAALVEYRNDEAENEAIALLEGALERTGQYRHKMAIGNIKMRQIRRHLAEARQAHKENPADEDLKKKFAALTKQRLNLEFEEFRERIKTYPTDMRWPFELAKRQMLIKKYDLAISNFQRARADPRFRANSSNFLGQCYLEKDWLDEAIATFREGVDNHPAKEDQIALELRYHLMDALQKKAEHDKSIEVAKESLQLASHILQTDINYRDITRRMEALRAMVKDLESAG